MTGLLPRVAFLCFAVIGAFFVSAGIILAQAASGGEAGEETKVPLRIRSTFVPGYEYVYKFTETTKVNRKYDNNSDISYKRERTFFLKFEQRPEERKGFYRYKVSVDSMRYKFTQGDAVVEFDSQADEMPASTFNDLVAYWVPQGRIFNIVYSPYREAVEVEGESIDWVIDFVTEGETRLSDTLNRFMWVRGVSLPHLAHFSDLEKGAVPTGTVLEDSTWHGKFNIELNGVNFKDTVQNTLVDYRGGHFVISSTVPSLEPIKETLRVYEIDKFVDVVGGSGKGTLKTHIDPKSVIKEKTAKFDAKVIYKMGNHEFSEEIDVEASWEYLTSRKI
jgi:hypothetical protein